MKLRLFVSAFLIAGSGISGFGQFDDLYYDPYKNVQEDEEVYDTSNESTSYGSYDDESYGYYDDYDGYYDDYDDYTYSTRIRRFNRPSYSFSYFSPVWGYGWRDPFYDPWYDSYWYGGNNVVIVVGNSGWNSWNRWNRWNSWGCGSGWNNWGGNNWGYNNYYGNNYYGNNNWYGHHNHYNNGNGNGNNNNSPYGNYYGSRKSGSSIASTKGRIEGPRKEVGPRNVPTSEVVADERNDNNASRNNKVKRSDYDNPAAKEERSSIYTRKRSESYQRDVPAADRNSDNTYKKSPRYDSDKTRDGGSKPAPRISTEKKRETQSPKKDEGSKSRSYESGRSSQGNSGNRSYEGGSSSKSQSTSRSSSSGSGGRSNSSPRKGN